MVALSAIGSGYVTAQNVELTCMSLAHPKNMIKKNYLFEKIQNFLISR